VIDSNQQSPTGRDRLKGLSKRSMLFAAAMTTAVSGPLALASSPAGAKGPGDDGPRTVSFNKTVSDPTPVVGETVTYSVVVTNTGHAAFNGPQEAAFTDSLANVLANGNYVAGSLTYDASIGSASYTPGSGIEWHTKKDFVGGSVTTITYQVQFTKAGGPLVNTVVSTSDGTSNCDAAGTAVASHPKAASCTATITVGGDQPTPLFDPRVAGALMVGAGGLGLIVVARRRSVAGRSQD
jgi:uncharacterized repeat protein (TIGR01451 family)